MFRFIVRKNVTEHRHLEDVERIYNVMVSRGVDTDMATCAYIWDTLSDDLCAGWIFLPEEDERLYQAVMDKARTLSHLKGFELE